MVLWLLWCYGCCAGGPEHLIMEIDGPYECVVIYALLRFTLAIAVFCTEDGGLYFYFYYLGYMKNHSNNKKTQSLVFDGNVRFELS